MITHYKDNNITLEDLVMVHRYLYYVLCSPVLTDAEYDVLQRQADIFCDASSPAVQVGSELASSYTPQQKQIANYL